MSTITNSQQSADAPASPLQRARPLLIAALLLGSVGFAAARLYGHIFPPSSITTPQRRANAQMPGPPGWAAGGPGGPSQGDREAMRAEFAAAIKATPEQMEKLEALRESAMSQMRASGGPGPGGWAPGQGNGPPMQMMLDAAKILTPQQMMDAGTFMATRMNQRLQRARKFLPPEEFAKLEKKANERRRSAESRMMSAMRQAFAGGSGGAPTQPPPPEKP
jgi:hypothetical protein